MSNIIKYKKKNFKWRFTNKRRSRRAFRGRYYRSCSNS